MWYPHKTPTIYLDILFEKITLYIECNLLSIPNLFQCALQYNQNKYSKVSSPGSSKIIEEKLTNLRRASFLNIVKEADSVWYQSSKQQIAFWSLKDVRSVGLVLLYYLQTVWSPMFPESIHYHVYTLVAKARRKLTTGSEIRGVAHIVGLLPRKIQVVLKRLTRLLHKIALEPHNNTEISVLAETFGHILLPIQTKDPFPVGPWLMQMLIRDSETLFNDINYTTQYVGIARALHNYNNTENGHLSFSKNDVLWITDRKQSGWWHGECNGKLGYFPKTWVHDLSQASMSFDNESTKGDNSTNTSKTTELLDTFPIEGNHPNDHSKSLSKSKSLSQISPLPPEEIPRTTIPTKFTRWKALTPVVSRHRQQLNQHHEKTKNLMEVASTNSTDPFTDDDSNSVGSGSSDNGILSNESKQKLNKLLELHNKLETMKLSKEATIIIREAITNLEDILKEITIVIPQDKISPTDTFTKTAPIPPRKTYTFGERKPIRGKRNATIVSSAPSKGTPRSYRRKRKEVLRNVPKKPLPPPPGSAIIPSPETLTVPTNKIIDYDELEFVRDLEKGHFGMVSKFMYRGQEVAVKRRRDDRPISKLSEDDLEAFLHEARLVAGLKDHPNVVTIVGVCIDPNKTLAIVTEYVHGGDLKSFLKKFEKYPVLLGSVGKVETAISRLATDPARFYLECCRDICHAMEHLHASGIIHRDLALRNVLLGKDGKCRVCDLGLARVGKKQQQDTRKAKGRSGLCGGVSLTITRLPLRWMAPESSEKQGEVFYSQKTDVWSFGITVWEVFMQGATPYKEHSSPLLVHKMVKEQNLRLKRPIMCPESVFMLVVEPCWRKDPYDRPSFKYLAATIDLLLESWNESDT